MSYYETSAKDGRGIKELMDDIMNQAFQIALDSLEKLEEKEKPTGVILDRQSQGYRSTLPRN